MIPWLFIQEIMASADLTASVLATMAPGLIIASNLTFQEQCLAFRPEQHVFNATRTQLQYVVAGATVDLPDNVAACGQAKQAIEANMCRVAMSVPTSNRSSFMFEMWLPETWTGRVLATGNGGIGGCVTYTDVAYGAQNGFATVGTNNGHNGTTGVDFYMNDDVVIDFSWRVLHTSVRLAKNLTHMFYGSPANKSYYIGCSLGGRQGLGAAEMFPEDYDGILTGSPAADFNDLYSWRASFYPLTGPANGSDFISPAMWQNTIHVAVMAQCDEIDGVKDGIIEDPTVCRFDPSKLLCSAGTNASATTGCLTAKQVDIVRAIYSPYLWPNGTLLYPAMQPGSEVLAASGLYSGAPFSASVGWFKYAVLENPAWDPLTYSLSDASLASQKNPGGIRTWPSSLAAFERRGGKLLTYHGQQDQQISSFNSIRLYQHLSSGMGYTPSQMDAFYRFFRVAGMGHCNGGPGAWVFGQYGGAARGVPFAAQTNVLAALVGWVEEGNAPEALVGTRFVNDSVALGVQYRHRQCRYPLRSTYKGGGLDPEDVDSWECRKVQGEEGSAGPG